MINRVVLAGRLTKDVEVRKTQSGLSVASFTVACDRRVSRNQQDGNQQTADFINCVAWRQSADFLGTYARKGAMIGVDGRIQTRTYDDKNGNKVYVTEVVCDNVSLLESRSTSQSRTGSASSANNMMGGNNAPDLGGYDNGSSSNDFGSDGFNTGPSLDLSSDDLPF